MINSYSRFRDRARKPASLLDLVNDKLAKLIKLGLPEPEARTFAVRLAKDKLGIE